MFIKTKIFPLKEIWETSLNIKYDMEIEYYKKFCGLHYKYKILRQNTDFYNDSEKVIYENWKFHILKTIEKLSLNELEKYSRFLNQQCRNKTTKLNSFQSLLIPYAICIIGSGIISPLLNLILNVDYFFAILTIIFLIILILIFKYCNHEYGEYAIKNCFYQDIKEIVDEKIRIIKTKEINSQ